MTPIEHRQALRTCHVQSYIGQGSVDGYFHKFTTFEGVECAIVEKENGEVVFWALANSALRFTDAQ